MGKLTQEQLQLPAGLQSQLFDDTPHPSRPAATQAHPQVLKWHISFIIPAEKS